MEQWFSPQADESMKMEGMETCLPVHTQPGTESGAASDTVTGGDIPADSQEYLAGINTDGKLSKHMLHLIYI